MPLPHIAMRQMLNLQAQRAVVIFLVAAGLIECSRTDCNGQGNATVLLLIQMNTMTASRQATARELIQDCPALEQLPVGWLTNPRSYQNRRRGIQAMINREFADLPLRRYDVCDRKSMRASLQQLKREGVGLVIADGGDGTVQGVITEVWHAFAGTKMPALAVIPGGRTNVISRDLNGAGDPRQMLRTIVQRYCEQRPQHLQQRRLIRIKLPDVPEQLAFLVSGGGLAAGIESCWDLQKKMQYLGPFRSLATPLWIGKRLLTTLPGRPLLDRRRVSLRIDDEAINGDHHQAVMVTMNKTMPLGIRPFWGDSGDSEDSILISVVAGQARGLWWRIVPIIMGWNRWLPEQHGYISRASRKIEMLIEESIHIDGERWSLEQPTELTLQVSEPISFITAAA